MNKENVKSVIGWTTMPVLVTFEAGRALAIAICDRLGICDSSDAYRASIFWSRCSREGVNAGLGKESEVDPTNPINNYIKWAETAIDQD